MSEAASLPFVEQAGITVDGVADEAAWAGAWTAGSFVTAEPVPGQPPTGTTTVAVLTDSRALYVLFTMTDPEPKRIRRPVGRRDSRFEDDFIGFYFDPDGTAQRAFLFGVTAGGVQLDGTLLASTDDDDLSWDGRWTSAVAHTDTGYTVEIAIPYQTVQLAYEPDQFGFLFLRRVGRNSELSSWPVLAPDVQGVLLQQAVVPVTLPSVRGQGLDILPELTWGWTNTGPATDRWGAYGVSPGLTLRYTPAPALGLAATINPDFSQVESDSTEIDINRRYAIYYEEKRPFFLDGQEWFTTPAENLIYTRSMAVPRYGLRATVNDSGWTVGALHVLDAAPPPSVSEGGGWSEDELEGNFALATVGRARRAVGQDGYIGLLLSDRTLPGTPLSNRLAGVDGRFRLSDRVVGEAMLMTSVTTDTTGPATIGPAAVLNGNYQAEHFFVDMESAWLSPEFRSENGFVTRADLITTWWEAGWNLYTQSPVIPTVLPLPVDMGVGFNHAGELRELVVEPDVSWQWGTGAFTYVEPKYVGERFAETWFGVRRIEAGAGGSVTRHLSGWLWGATGEGLLYDPENPRIGWQDQVELGPEFLLTSWLQLGTSAAWERFLEQDGRLVYAGYTARVRLEAYATSQIWARFIVDQSSFDDSFSQEVLLAYERTPGRALFLGGRFANSAVGSDADSDADSLQSWQVFSKLSWVFQL